MRRLLSSASFFAFAFGSTVAFAKAPPPSSPDATGADALFTEAKSLRDAGKYPEACAKFAQSDRLAPGIGVSLYLGDCYDHVGKTASAWTAFRAAEKRALAKNDDRARVAAARAETLEASVSRIVLAVSRSLHRPGVAVAIDGGAPVPPGDYALGVPVDPGEHVVTLTLGDHVAHTETVRVAGGGARAAVILGEPPLSADVFAPKPAAPESHPPVDMRFAAGVSLALVGVTGVVTGAAFLYEKNQSMTDGSPDGSPTYDHHAGAISATAFAVGGAAVVGAVVLYLTAPKRTETATVTLAPTFLARGGGATFSARF